MGSRNIMPVFREQSDFFKKYSKRSVVEMLSLHGFVVNETTIDDEDIVHFEDHKKFVFENIGIDDISFNVKREFVAEYPLTAITSVFVEGRYIRKPTGEKMYSSYYYYFYKSGYLPNGATINGRVYADRVIKSVFLRTFEKQLLMFSEKNLN
ncbi:hypothetical protein IGL98_000957 [Enterococcus sp. DIV0840]|uniref:hypothetical protein n=1 Tax=unclassified Enterococcus TaxID=2608891 RepID=UPI001A8C451E|nr:hypothetical protein [Enterococcus sp. DIV0849a]MBO0433645.1 hypothetical protein [Enterococcus sp. DIV0849a]